MQPKNLERTDYSTTTLSIEAVKIGQPEKSQFASLSPIYDKQTGILRIGGRLQASNIPFEQKHPALLPKDHLFTKLIMEQIHQENHHAGAQALLAITRQRYWPINGKRVAQAIVKNCILCVRSKPHLMEQIMGNLPAERVTADQPYVSVGLDFAGPITIYHRIRGKRTSKAYICVFVCFVTKAVHLEAATDLTTAAFMNCLKRFIARRGIPKKIFSDNGTNFVGAHNQLKELATMINSPDHQRVVEKYCHDHYIEWKFIPPRSPHFAGLVEAAVKSAKLDLIKILHNVNFSYDELVTSLAEIELILNSRPLTPMSNDPNDLQPLTAGHFLIGRAMNAIDDRKLPHRSMLNMWHKIRFVRNTFWERWSKEYLAELQYRQKWTKEWDNIVIGSLVIIKEDNIPPLQWRMARIIATIADKNGKIRVVELKTKNGFLKRSIHQVCPLPVNSAIYNIDKTKERTAKAEIRVPPPGDIKTGIPGRNVRSGVFPKNFGVIPENRPKTQQVRQVAVRSGVCPKRSKASTRNSPKIQQSQQLADQSRDDMSGNQRNWNGRLRRRETIKAPARHRWLYKSNAAILIMAFFGLIFGAMADEPCSVTTFKHNPGLFYEDIGQVSLSNDEWEIKCHLDMEAYWNEEEGIKKIIKQLKDVCPEAHPMEYCKITSDQFDQQMSVLKMKNELINGFSSDQLRERRAFKHRSKRGWFNGFGVAGKEVFGLLNEDDAQKFEGEIAELRINKDHIQELLKNQTSIQEVTTNIIKRDEAAVQEQLNHILHEIENIKSKDTIGKMSVFTSLSLQAMTLMTGYREIQSAILGILSHLNHGRVPAILITPAQLRRQLMFIISYIAHDTMIPGDDQTTEDPLRTLKLLLNRPNLNRTDMYNTQSTVLTTTSTLSADGDSEVVHHTETENEIIVKADATLGILIVIVIMFLLINVVILFAYVIKRNYYNKTLKRKLDALSLDGTTDDDVKRSNSNDGDESFILDVVRKKNDYGPVHGNRSPINGFLLSRELSTSTVDAHTKVCDWMAQEISRKGKKEKGLSPSFSIKSRGFFRRNGKVSVAVDATPNTRTASVLRQEPAELLQQSFNYENKDVIICQDVDIDASLLDAVNLRDSQENSSRRNSISSVKGTADIIKIDHRHSRSDPVQTYYRSFKQDEDITVFIEDDDVRNREEPGERELLSPEAALKSIQMRNYPKVLPNYPQDTTDYVSSSKKRRSLPLQYFSMNSFKMPPVPPPRTTSTLGRRPSDRRDSKTLTTSPIMMAEEPPVEEEPEITCNMLHVGPLIPKSNESLYSTLRKKPSTPDQNKSFSFENSIILENVPQDDKMEDLTEQGHKPSGIKPPSGFKMTNQSHSDKKTAPKIIIKPTLNRQNSSDKNNQNSNIPRVQAPQDASTSSIPPIGASKIKKRKLSNDRDRSTSDSSSSETSSSTTGTVKHIF